MASGAVGGNMHMDTRAIKVADVKSEVIWVLVYDVSTDTFWTYFGYKCPKCIQNVSKNKMSPINVQNVPKVANCVQNASNLECYFGHFVDT